jgi:hypothetical protein
MLAQRVSAGDGAKRMQSRGAATQLRVALSRVQARCRVAPTGLELLFTLTQGLRPGLTSSAPAALDRRNFEFYCRLTNNSS